MSKKSQKPLFDFSQAIIIERVAVTFLQNINNKGLIIKAGTTKKAERHTDNTTGEEYLYVDFEDKGTMKMPVDEIVHKEFGELVRIHDCGSKEANLMWFGKEDITNGN